MNTQRSSAGTHTTRLPARIALTVATATASGVVAKGAGCRPWVIAEWTNPGRTISTDAPEPASESPSPCAKPSQPGLRGAVHEVRLAHPLTGDARQHDELAVALGAEAGGGRHACTHGAGKVHLDDRGCGRGVLVELGLLSELTERDDHDVEVAVAGCEIVDERLVRRGVDCVEPNDVDHDTFQTERPAIDLVGASDREYDGPGGRAGERSHDGAADVARAAEEHDGLGFTECVLQWILPVTDLMSVA